MGMGDAQGTAACNTRGACVRGSPGRSRPRFANPDAGAAAGPALWTKPNLAAVRTPSAPPSDRVPAR
jgi:hypothetical protein